MCNPRPHSLLSVGTGAQMPQRRGAGQGTARAAAHAAPAPPPAAAGLDYGKEEVALGSAFPAAFLALLAQWHRPVGACIAELMPASVAKHDRINALWITGDALSPARSLVSQLASCRCQQEQLARYAQGRPRSIQSRAFGVEEVLTDKY